MVSEQIPEIQQLAEECAERILVRGSSNKKSIDLMLSTISAGDELALHLCFKIIGMVSLCFPSSPMIRLYSFHEK